MKILFACSELYPLIKTGGLADVAFNLPLAIQRMGHDIRIVLPAYRPVKEAAPALTPVAQCQQYGQPLTLLQTIVPGTAVPLYLLDCPPLFDRQGGPYGNPEGADWPDNGERFGRFCQAVAALALNDPGWHWRGLPWQPDLLHGNDWQTGLAVALVSQQAERPATVFTIHNLAYQGLFPYDLFQRLHLPAALWDFRALEFYGKLSFIKGGVACADMVNTVSRGYAAEVTTPEFGCGLDGLLRFRGKRFCGIVNGIDTDLWDPATDAGIAVPYDQHSLDAKRENKRALVQRFGLPLQAEGLLLGMVSRLTQQKGIDLLLQALPELLGLPLQLVVLGAGDVEYEARLQQLARQYPHRIGLLTTYDEVLAHQIMAGADALLIPSNYEPCGLTQMYSQHYGTIPVARSVGGLVDTIVNATALADEPTRATGILFREYSAEALVDAVKRALDLFQVSPRWRALQLNGMQMDFSWGASAAEYLRLYEQARGGNGRAVLAPKAGR